MENEAEPADTASWHSSTEIVSLDAGEFLFREGDSADALYVVKNGTLRIVSGGTVYETLRSGGIVGEMAIVDRSARRSASVIAGTHAELMKIDTAQFLVLVAHNPDFSLEVMRVMARRLRIMNQRYRRGIGG
jgi:CRP-like cAMP-binding protein